MDLTWPSLTGKEQIKSEEAERAVVAVPVLGNIPALHDSNVEFAVEWFAVRTGGASGHYGKGVEPLEVADGVRIGVGTK